MVALLTILGAGIGAGVVLIVNGLRKTEPHQIPSGHKSTVRLFLDRDDVGRRALRGACAALVCGLLTRWPVAMAGAGALGFFSNDLFGGRARRAFETERSAAIASWTEMLRDTMAAAAGLEQAIITTAPLAPQAIRPEIQGLVVRLQRERLGPALARLADDLADPTADLVVAALTLAASGEAQDLHDLLSSLAGAARDNATMRLKVDASRARTRTSVRIISAVTVGMAGLLVILNRTYLKPFDSAVGQTVLLGVVACFATALWWLVAMARYVAPERFLVAPREAASR